MWGNLRLHTCHRVFDSGCCCSRRQAPLSGRSLTGCARGAATTRAAMNALATTRLAGRSTALLAQRASDRPRRVALAVQPHFKRAKSAKEKPRQQRVDDKMRTIRLQPWELRIAAARSTVHTYLKSSPGVHKLRTQSAIMVCSCTVNCSKKSSLPYGRTSEDLMPCRLGHCPMACGARC